MLVTASNSIWGGYLTLRRRGMDGGSGSQSGGGVEDYSSTLLLAAFCFLIPTEVSRHPVFCCEPRPTTLYLHSRLHTFNCELKQVHPHLSCFQKDILSHKWEKQLIHHIQKHQNKYSKIKIVEFRETWKHPKTWGKYHIKSYIFILVPSKKKIGAKSKHNCRQYTFLSHQVFATIWVTPKQDN